MMIDRKGRTHRADGQFEPVLYETTRGPMTRREIAKAANLPLNTIHGRLFRGVRGDDLFAPAGLTPRTPRGRKGPYGKYQRRAKHDDVSYVETWAARKKRLARERADASGNSP